MKIWVGLVLLGSFAVAQQGCAGVPGDGAQDSAANNLGAAPSTVNVSGMIFGPDLSPVPGGVAADFSIGGVTTSIIDDRGSYQFTTTTSGDATLIVYYGVLSGISSDPITVRTSFHVGSSGDERHDFYLANQDDYFILNEAFPFALTVSVQTDSAGSVPFARVSYVSESGPGAAAADVSGNAQFTSMRIGTHIFTVQKTGSDNVQTLPAVVLSPGEASPYVLTVDNAFAR